MANWSYGTTGLSVCSSGVSRIPVPSSASMNSDTKNTDTEIRIIQNDCSGFTEYFVNLSTRNFLRKMSRSTQKNEYIPKIDNKYR